MIAATILPLMASGGNEERAIALASILAIMVAAIMVAAIMLLAAVAKLGFVADLISKPTMIGYMNGLALTILVGQLPKLFGFKVSADGLIAEIAGFVEGLAKGEAVPAAAAVGIAEIILVLVLQRWLPKVPAVLISVWPRLPRRWLKDPARRKIERYGLTRTIDPRHFFPTIEAAVAAFREQTGTQWTAAGQRPAGQTAADSGPPRH